MNNNPQFFHCNGKRLRVTTVCYSGLGNGTRKLQLSVCHALAEMDELGGGELTADGETINL